MKNNHDQTIEIFVHATKKNKHTMSCECNMKTTYTLVTSIQVNSNFGTN